MGKDLPWRYSSGLTLNCVSNLGRPNIGQQSTNSMVFPTYANPFGCAFTGNVARPILGLAGQKFLQMNPASVVSLSTSGFAAADAVQKRLMVIDQSGDLTNLVFCSAGSSFVCPSLINPSAEQPRSDETNVSDGRGGEEMHEDTEEIDALLYSDSEYDCEEEEASTGHSPLETMTMASTDEVFSSSAVPAKRRRVDAGLDACHADTASSAAAYHWVSNQNRGHEEDDDARSSHVRGGEQGGADTGVASWAVAASSHRSKRLKREKIQETVGVLKRIIPGGRGRDTATVLDDAIRYLTSLRLKAKACIL